MATWLSPQGLERGLKEDELDTTIPRTSTNNPKTKNALLKSDDECSQRTSPSGPLSLGWACPHHRPGHYPPSSPTFLIQTTPPYSPSSSLVLYSSDIPTPEHYVIRCLLLLPASRTLGITSLPYPVLPRFQCCVFVYIFFFFFFFFYIQYSCAGYACGEAHTVGLFSLGFSYLSAGLHRFFSGVSVLLLV